MAAVRVGTLSGEVTLTQNEVPTFSTELDQGSLRILDHQGAALAIFAPGEWFYVFSGPGDE